MVIIRQAIKKDLIPLLEVCHHFWIEYNALLTEKEMQQKLETSIEQGIVYIALIKEKIVGYVWCEYLGKENKLFPMSVFINELWVEPEYRGKGIGKDLVSFALKQSYLPEYSYFSVTHNPKESWLTDFYRKFGFKVKGKTDVGNIVLTRIKNSR